MAKRVVPMSLHRYNWNLPQKLKAGRSQPYFACSGPGSDCSQLQVIAFSGNMEKLLGSSASWHEFALLLRGLAALGVVLDRAVAWPSLPCNTSWVSRLALAHSFICLCFACILWICSCCSCPQFVCLPSPYSYSHPLLFTLPFCHQSCLVWHTSTARPPSAATRCVLCFLHLQYYGQLAFPAWYQTALMVCK